MRGLGLEGVLSLASLLALSFGLLLALRRALKDAATRAAEALPWSIVACIALLGLAHHLLLVAPAFVHAELYGPELITDILQYPATAPRHAYGATSYLVLGGLSQLFGRSAEGVLTANAVVFSLSTIPLAALAARLSSAPRAGLYAAVLYASSPIVARLARSEDAHGVALFFGLVAAVALDIAARERSRLALFVAIPALSLMLSSRQTFYGWVPMLLLLALGRPKAHATRWRAAPVAVLVTVFVTLLVARTARIGDEGFGILLLAYLRLAVAPLNLLSCLRAHPSVDFSAGAGLLLPLVALGAWRFFTQREVPRAALATGLVISFAATLPAVWPAPGASWAFRLPFYGLYLLLASLGAERFEAVATLRVRALGSTRGALLLASAFAAVGLLSSASRENRAVNAELADYVWLRDALLLEKAKGPVGLIGLSMHYPAPRYAASMEVAQLLHIPFTTPDMLGAARSEPKRNWLFHEGLGCSAYTVTELLLPDAQTEEMVGARLMAEPELLDLLLFNQTKSFGAGDVKVPPSRRAACLGLVGRADAAPIVGPWIAAHDDPPAVLYTWEKGFAPRLIPTAP